MSISRNNANPQLTFSWIQPQTLKPGISTQLFPLEFFNENSLHLPDAQPQFNLISCKKWYIGLPLSVIGNVYGDSQQTLYSPALTIKIKDKHGQILEQSAPPVMKLEPQKNLSLRVNFIPIRESHVELTLTFKYQIENTPYTKRKTLEIDILPSVSLECKTFPPAKNLMQFTLYNKLPYILYNVTVSTDANDNFSINQHLNPNEVYSGIIHITKPHTSLTASFTARNFPRAFVSIPCPMQRPNIPSLVSVELENVPRECPAMKPFKIIIHAKNITHDQTLQGKIGVAEFNDSIFVFGNNDLTFKGVKPGETIDIPIEFVAVKQGTYKFPAFDFYIDTYKSFRVNNDEGILVVGHNDNEK